MNLFGGVQVLGGGWSGYPGAKHYTLILPQTKLIKRTCMCKCLISAELPIPAEALGSDRKC